MTDPQKPQRPPRPYRPSEAALRLEQEIAQRQARERELGIEPLPPLLPPTEERSATAEIADIFSQKFGLSPLLPGEAERIDAENKQKGRELAREQEYSWRLAAFNRVCPPRFQEPWDWTRVKPDVQRSEAEKVFGWQYGPQGLYVVGESGHSKTRAVMCLAKRLILDEGRDVLLMDGIAFSNLMSKAFGTPEHTEKMLARVVAAEILIVDDFAKRWPAATEEGAFAVIDRRTARNRPMICTLNYTAEQIRAMQDARGELAILRDVATPLLRRLEDYCTAAVL